MAEVDRQNDRQQPNEAPPATGSVPEGQDRDGITPVQVVAGPAWQLSFQAWMELLLLGVVLWFTLTYAELLLEVLWVLFGALLLSLAIRPLADMLARWQIPRGATVLGVYAGLLGGLVLLGNLVAPVIETELARLQANSPALLRAALSRVTFVPGLSQWLPSAGLLAQNLSQRLDFLVSTMLSAVAGLGGLALDLLIVLILAYFFATDTGLLPRLIARLTPERYRPRVLVTLDRVEHRLTRWVLAQVAIASYFALTFSIGLTILGVPFAFTIGLVGGVLEVVPYIGGMVAFALAVVSALSVYPLLALWVVLFYLVVVEIESHIIAPAFYGRVMGLHPAVVLVALLIGAKIKGVLGVFFAVPIAVIMASILHELRAPQASSPVEPAAPAPVEPPALKR